MKKFSIILVMLAVLMAGCTKDVETPVPVRFGGISADVALTKAMINTPEELSGKTFSISAFDLGASDQTMDDGLNMRNVAAGSSQTSIRLTDEYYYPMVSSASFGFYSYYPYSSTYEGTETGAYVTLPVTSVYDILWAKSDRYGLGYNAESIRSGVQLPSFKYEHKTACISFLASKDTEETEVSIINIGIAEVPTKAKLCLNTGEFVEYLDYSTTDSPKQVSNLSGSGGNLSSFVFTTEPKEICQPTFIVPAEKILVMADVRIGGNTSRNWVEFELDPTELGAVTGDGGETGFLAGYHYVFNLKVKGEASEISFSLSIENEDEILDFEANQWEEAFK